MQPTKKEVKLGDSQWCDHRRTLGWKQMSSTCFPGTSYYQRKQLIVAKTAGLNQAGPPPDSGEVCWDLKTWIWPQVNATGLMRVQRALWDTLKSSATHPHTSVSTLVSQQQIHNGPWVNRERITKTVNIPFENKFTWWLLSKSQTLTKRGGSQDFSQMWK